MRILLDTNAYTEFRRGHAAMQTVIRKSERVCISLVVLGELLAGFYRGQRLRHNLEDLERFLSSAYVTLLPMTRNTADRFGRIQTRLRAKGTPLPTNDIWIAAQALEHGLDLVSLDAHFSEVEGLAWIRPEA